VPEHRSTAVLATEFDAIARALASQPHADRLTPAERHALHLVPAGPLRVLDAGCGAGALSRALARRGAYVLGVDASPAMVELARARSVGAAEYHVADLLHDGLPPAAFDAVVSVATVHHAPLDDIVPRLAASVRPGGVLVIQDVVSRPRLGDLPLNVVAGAVRVARRLVQREPASPRVRDLYLAHGASERYLEPHEVAAAYRDLLAGATVAHHLEWRYTVCWRRPAVRRPSPAGLAPVGLDQR